VRIKGKEREYKNLLFKRQIPRPIGWRSPSFARLAFTLPDTANDEPQARLKAEREISKAIAKESLTSPSKKLEKRRNGAP
jgi:hypothetical protein